MHVRWWWSVVAALVSLRRVPAASAAPTSPTVLIEVEDDPSIGPASCPSQADLEARVAARLGRAPFTASSPSLVFDVRRSIDQGELVASVEARMQTAPLGRQRLVSRSRNCVELTEAIALAISIVVEQAAESNAAEQSAHVSARRETEPRPRPSAASSAAPVSWATAAGSRVSFGLAPAAVVGVTMGVRVQRAAWQVGASLLLDTKSTLSVPEGTVATRLSAGGAIGCRARGPLALCGVAFIGELEGRGVDGPRGRTDTSVLLGFGLRAALEQPFGDTFGLLAYADLELSPIRTTLYLERTAVWRSPLFQASFGLEWITHFDARRTER